VIVRCFDAILNYQRAESVQFEDDDNYYHVRIVPKVIIAKPQRVVKRIRPEAADDLVYEVAPQPEEDLDDDLNDFDDDNDWQEEDDFTPPPPRPRPRPVTRPRPRLEDFDDE